MAQAFLKICLLLATVVATAVSVDSNACHEADTGAACRSGGLEIREEQESSALKVEMLQSHAQKVVAPAARTSAVEEKAGTTVSEKAVEATSKATDATKESDLASALVSNDHNGKVCMLCGKPLAERVNREYTEFREDCGGMSSEKGPNSSTLAMPVAKLIETGENGVVKNGFCQLNFAKSCVDAVANKDYLYWAKSINLASTPPENAVFDGRYCRLNGFLESSMVALQHDFQATQAKANDLCKTKYAKYNLDNITFADMMTAARYDDKAAPTLHEAEVLAAWNCAMGDLGCDMALCAYSFCEKDEGTGLYGECEGWHPVHGMPAPNKM